MSIDRESYFIPTPSVPSRTALALEFYRGIVANNGGHASRADARDAFKMADDFIAEASVGPASHGGYFTRPPTVSEDGTG